MLNFDIEQVLRSQFACRRCHVSRWACSARPEVRECSTIYRLRCTRCGEQIVAKVSGGRQSNDNDREQLRDEYATLRVLETAFSQDQQYGTLMPLGYLETGGHSIMVTRLFRGESLTRYLRRVDASDVREVLRSVGVWLRRLHTADRTKQSMRSLNVADRIDHLQQQYGQVLRANRNARSACEFFVLTGRVLDSLSFEVVRIHGDFKPDNMLCSATRYVGLDVSWSTVAAAVYDLAPFLNHLWLSGLGSRGASAQDRYAFAEQAFLAGYGTEVEMRALRWMQLYFALCQLGGYRSRGSLASGYARLKVWPLVRKTAMQVQEVL